MIEMETRILFHKQGIYIYHGLLCFVKVYDHAWFFLSKQTITKYHWYSSLYITVLLNEYT